MTVHRTGVFTLSGYNQRAVVALCRYCRTQQLPLYVAARSGDDSIFLTQHADRVFTTRQSAELRVDELCGWVDRLRHEGNHERILLAPSTEFFNRFVLSNRQILAQVGGVVPLVDQALYEAVSDKRAFGAMCRRHGIALPLEHVQPPTTLPFVAKPTRYASADGRQLKPHLILAQEDWERFSAHERPSDFYFQEFVHGQSIYLLMYLPAHGPALMSSQENLVQQAQGGSIILARRSEFHVSDEAKRYERMLRTEGFRGLVMVEVRRWAETGYCVMIEANPRMWGPIQFALDNGVDLFGALLEDQLGEASELLAPVSVSGEYYFWSGGLVPASQPYAFHGYAPARFMDNYARITACDLFQRDDSLALYRHELGHLRPCAPHQ